MFHLHILYIPWLLWRTRETMSKQTEMWKVSCPIGTEMEAEATHQGSIAISLEWESWGRMEIDSFTQEMVLWKRKMLF